MAPPPPLPTPDMQTSAAPTGAGRLMLVVLLLNILCIACAEYYLKRGADETAAQGLSAAMSLFGIAALGSIQTIIGIVFYIIAFLLWMYALRTVPLALAFNFTALNQVLVPVSAWAFLHEKISPIRWLGIAVVTVGFVLLVPVLAQAEQKTEEMA